MIRLVTRFSAVSTLALLCVVAGPAFAQAPQFLGSWGPHGSATESYIQAVDVAVDSHGDVYVSDTWNGHIEKFTNDGAFILEWGSPGSEPGQLRSPLRLAISPEGDVLVADVDNFRIQRFSPTGDWLTAYGSSGDLPGQFSSLPFGIAVSGSGILFVTQGMQESLDKFSLDGTFLSRSRLAPPDAPWGIWGAYDLAMDAQDRLYVPINGNDLFVFDSDCGFLSQWPVHAYSITIAPNGHLYALNLGYGGPSTVSEYTLEGTLLRSWTSPASGPEAFGQGSGITVDANENIFITNGRRVFKYGSLPVPTTRSTWGRIKNLGGR